ncbi:piggyBac transposable element-derived protein 4-like [Ylistrum balloti]|uniref:piggyBac transposable element-derived protein 4-like n=1 Tax=Ylistrum balloti TaxID=509963 RepID=UPI002905A698|nr:piggyBac transposable element-derived protein 4-like [Ylistrum balloti]
MADLPESSDESVADFDVFDEEDVREAHRNLERIQNDLQDANDESDIDFSDNESEESEDDDDPFLQNLNFEWDDVDLFANVLPEFTKNTGVNHHLQMDAKPIDYLKFIPAPYFDVIAEETNRYADQKGPDPRWQPTTPDEVRAFISINIIMGIRQLPRLWNYWSTDERFSDPYISSIMTKSRYMKLNQYIHLRDTSDVPGRDSPDYDPLCKVRTLINCISPTLKENYNPGKCLSVDEGMIGYKGRIHFRQYMPAKPTKWGIKVWQICESDTGYCCGFDIYTGKKKRWTSIRTRL